MVKKLLTCAVAGMFASSGMAAVSLQTVSFGITPVLGSAIVDFEGSNVLPSGFTSSQTGNVTLQNGSTSGVAAEPMDDHSQYLAISNGSYSLMSNVGYSFLNFYWGSIDAGNRVDLLDQNGNSFFHWLGNDALMSSTANGDWWASATNRTVKLTSTGQKIYGVKFSYDSTAFELDNVGFGAVPEPATWAMMIVGFGLIGAALRASRKSTKQVVSA